MLTAAQQQQQTKEEKDKGDEEYGRGKRGAVRNQNKMSSSNSNFKTL